MYLPLIMLSLLCANDAPRESANAVVERFILCQDVERTISEVETLLEKEPRKYVWIICRLEDDARLRAKLKGKPVRLLQTDDLPQTMVWVYRSNFVGARQLDPYAYHHFLNGKLLGPGPIGLKKLVEKVGSVKAGQVLFFLQSDEPPPEYSNFESGMANVGGLRFDISPSWENKLKGKLDKTGAIRMRFSYDTYAPKHQFEFKHYRDRIWAKRKEHKEKNDPAAQKKQGQDSEETESERD